MALRDELRCLDVGRTSGRAIAGYRCTRAYLLRLRFRLRDLSDAVKTPPGYANVGAAAVGNAVQTYAMLFVLLTRSRRLSSCGIDWSILQYDPPATDLQASGLSGFSAMIRSI